MLVAMCCWRQKLNTQARCSDYWEQVRLIPLVWVHDQAADSMEVGKTIVSLFWNNTKAHIGMGI